MRSLLINEISGSSYRQILKPAQPSRVFKAYYTGQHLHSPLLQRNPTSTRYPYIITPNIYNLGTRQYCTCSEILPMDTGWGSTKRTARNPCLDGNSFYGPCSLLMCLLVICPLSPKNPLNPRFKTQNRKP